VKLRASRLLHLLVLREAADPSSDSLSAALLLGVRLVVLSLLHLL
jgi:hypothetical protein